jgi:hypothetical protein
LAVNVGLLSLAVNVRLLSSITISARLLSSEVDVRLTFFDHGYTRTSLLGG